MIIPKSFGPWSVICTVVKGYALPKMDLLGKVAIFLQFFFVALIQGQIDAFVKVYSGRTFVCATKVVSKEYNPVWNHVCPPVLLQSYGEGVRFEVFDYDRGKDDDLVGIVALSTMELIRLASVGLPACATFDFTQAFKIPFKKNKNGGELTIRFQISWPPELIHLPMHAKVEALQTIQENKVFSFLVEKGITPYFMADLMSMSRFDIAFVCDDSGSMLTSAGKRFLWIGFWFCFSFLRR